jgi:hypothetical protein
MDCLKQLFTAGGFPPHGYCCQWNWGLVWLHVLSDALIAVAYFTIPFTLLWFIPKRRDLRFSWMFALFGVFIVALRRNACPGSLESLARAILAGRLGESGYRNSVGIHCHLGKAYAAGSCAS